MKKRVVGFAAFIGSLALAGLAYAADAPEAVTFRSFVVDVILPALATLILGVVPIVLGYLARRFKLDNEWTKSAVLEKAAEQGVQYAEERVAAMIKRAGDGPLKPAAPSKLDLAVQFVERTAPGAAAEKIDQLVHVALAKLKGAGATGEREIK